MKRVAVVGGGLSGLTVAHLLARDGHDVICFEPSGRPGGLLRTISHEGFLCETGPQGLLDGGTEVRGLLDSLDLTPRVLAGARSAKRRFVYHRGQLRPVPSGPFSLMSSDLLSASAKWRLLQEPFAREPAPADESVYDFGVRRLGPEAAEALVAPGVIGVFAGDARRLSLRSAFPRLAALEDRHGSLLKGLRAARREGAGPGKLVSFPGGLEELPRALVAALGPRVVTAAVGSLSRAGRGWRVELAEGAREVDEVVLATPPRVSADLLAAHAPTAAEVLRGLPLASLAVVVLGFRRADIGMDLQAYGFLVARGEAPTILGCQYESTVFPSRAPEGQVLLRVLIGGVFDPAAVDESDEALVHRAVSDLGVIAGLTAQPDARLIWRHRQVLPQYELGHEGRARAAEEDLGRVAGLHLIGVPLRGVGLADCIRNATALARRLSAPAAG